MQGDDWGEGPAKRATAGWLSSLAVYREPRLIAVLLMGFSSGLPLALTAATLSFWLAEIGVSLTTIGFFSLVGISYNLKFLWSPLVDRVRVDPDERRMLPCAPLVQRSKDEGGNVEAVARAAVRDLLHPHDAFAGHLPAAIGLGLLAQHPREVGTAAVERLRRRGWPRLHSCLRLGLLGGGRLCADGRAAKKRDERENRREFYDPPDGGACEHRRSD